MRQPSQEHVRVLLIDDDPGDQLLMRRALREFPIPCTIQICDTAEVALRELHQSAPDLIFLDLNLPGMNGHEFLSTLRQDERLKHTVVIVLSTSGAQRDIDTSYSLGANSYLQKPSTMNALRDAMRTVGAYWTQAALLPKPV